MNLLEITETQKVGREEAAARLRALANALSKNNAVEYGQGDLRFTVNVPDEVDFKVEIELHRTRSGSSRSSLSGTTSAAAARSDVESGIERASACRRLRD